MRTVLARLHATLKFSFLTKFEDELKNCSKLYSGILTEVSTPSYEHYLDSKLVQYYFTVFLTARLN